MSAAALRVGAWTLRTALDRFLAVAQGAPGTIRNHRDNAACVVRYFGDRPIGDFAGARGGRLVAGYLEHETGGGDRGQRETFGGRGNLVAVLSYSAIRQRLAVLKQALYGAAAAGELAVMPEPWPVVLATAPERAGMRKPEPRKRRQPPMVRAPGADEGLAAGTVTLSTALGWMARATLRGRAESTIRMHADHGRWLLAFFSDRALADFEGPRGYALLEEYVEAEHARGVKFVTAGKRLKTLRLALREAHRRGAVSGLPPWPDIPADGEARKRHLTYAEYQAVRPLLSERVRLWLDLAVWTGMHSSDVGRLAWTDVDLGQGPGMGLGAGRATWRRSNTKNREDRVWLPMPDELRAILAAAWEACEPRPPLDEPIAGARDRWNLRKLLRRACWAAKIPPFSPIDCRHTLVTWWIDRGGHVDGLKLWLGHAARSEMVQRHYLAVTPAMVDSGVEALNRVNRVLDPMGGG